MIYKFKNLAAIVWLFTLSLANAQTPVSVATDATVEGTQYLDDAFVAGEIYSGTVVQKVMIRYNIFQDVMEYKQRGPALALDPTPAIKKVRIGTATFVVQKFESKGKTKNGFFALLDSGKVMLFAKKTVTFLDAKVGGALDGSNTPARYTRSADVFYYKIGNSALQEVETIKSMIASFPDKREDLIVYAKKEKISPRKEKTLVQLVQYYNSL